MSIPILFAVIAFQVLVFQFLLGLHAFALTDMTFGARDLPEPVAGRLRAFQRKARITGNLLGAVLLVGVVVLSFGLSVEPGTRKLGLAVVSLASSLILAIGMFVGRRATTQIAALLPESGVRSAVLEPRSLGRYYPILWEWVGPVLLLATVLLTVLAVPRIPGGESNGFWGLWIRPFFQGTYLLFTCILSYRLAGQYALIPQASRSYAGSPEEVAALDDTLRVLKLRILLAVKVLVTLMIGLMQFRKVQELTGGASTVWVGPAIWALVALLLVLFAFFIRRAAEVRRQLRVAN
jgi:hypothetical protein